MASGSKIRPLARLLDECEAPLWVIGPTGRLAYLSADCEAWLGTPAQSLVDRRSVAGSSVSDDPLDRLAASLAPPPGMSARGTASLRVQPPGIGAHRPEPREARYVRVGNGNLSIVVGVAGHFDDRAADPELQDAIAVRQRLDAWRKQHAALATIATAGDSVLARRMRRRIAVAASVRSDLGLFGPTGCGSESIANRIHQRSSPGETFVRVDGPLMDAELLDATMMPALHRLNDSTESRATALVCGLDEMPLEAQQRLVSLLAAFNDRLRLIALCGPQPKTIVPASEKSEAAEILSLHDEMPHGLCGELIETLSAMTIVCHRLADRVEDIPAIATGMLDHRRSAGEGTAERMSRAALDALVIYPWPRNLDELDEAIRHAVRTAPGSSIGVDHLPLAIRSYRPGAPAAPGNTLLPLDESLRRYQRRIIMEAVDSAGGNRAEAARRLGISRARLLRKLEESAEAASESADES